MQLEGAVNVRDLGGHRTADGLKITGIVVVVLLALLVVADRVAARIAENEAASQIKPAGFPVKPKVDIEGFPFLTQLAARDFQKVDNEGVLISISGSHTSFGG